ncbi:MAG: PA domain-containing protein [Limisphaerales bacterium]
MPSRCPALAFAVRSHVLLLMLTLVASTLAPWNSIAVAATPATPPAPTPGLFRANTRVDDVNRTQRGFRIRPHQVDFGQPNTIAWTEAQLAGLRGPNRVDLALAGIPADAEGFVAWDDKPLDFRNPSGGAGRFPLDFGFDPLGIPGFDIDGTRKANEDNSAFEVLAFIEFPSPGVHTLNIASDDGFRLQTGVDGRDVFAETLAEFDGGRGMDEGTTFDVWVEEAGVYPVRLVWENGTEGAALEWAQIEPGGEARLVGDPDDPLALKCFRTRAQPVPYVQSIHPGIDATDVHPLPEITVVLAEAGAIVPGSIRLTLDGEALGLTLAPNGTSMHIRATPVGALDPGSTHQVALSYTDTRGAVVSRAWSFSVVPSVQPLPPELAGTLASATLPGFRVRTWQINPAPNQVDPNLRIASELSYSEAVLAGRAGSNFADSSDFTEGGFHLETGTIDYSAPQDGFSSTPSGAILPPTEGRPFPGIPGIGAAPTEGFVVEILTHVAFPSPGIRLMGVASDDGFKVTPTHYPGSLPLEILAPSSLAGTVAAVPSVRGENQGGGIFGPLPPHPVEADVVPVIGNEPGAPFDEGCGSALLNAASVRGRIALVRRGTCTFVEKVRNAAEAGAVAVLVVNDRGDPPIIAGGEPNDLPIPCVMISQDSGRAFFSATGLRARLAADRAPVLGAFNGRRSAQETTAFAVEVLQPGVYPFRLIAQQENDRARLMWFEIHADGSRTLVNDPEDPRALRAYRNSDRLEPPRLEAVRGASGLTLRYDGSLQAADRATGPYLNVPGAPRNGPFTEPTDRQALRYYRSRL